MTVVIVGFLGGLTFEEWYVWCQDSPKDPLTYWICQIRQKQIKERYEQDRLLRASQHDATDGSDDEYVTTDDDEPDSPVPQPVSNP